MVDDYLDEFLDTDYLQEESKEKLPTWVCAQNSSLKAYEAISDLQSKKKQYIRRHGLKSHYKKKSSYHISKAEVARIVGASPQSLFNSVAYSNALSRYLIEVNEKLNDLRLSKISKNKGGLRSKQKEDLVKDLQDATSKNNELLIDTVDKVYERTLSKLPLDVKRKLKLMS